MGFDQPITFPVKLKTYYFKIYISKTEYRLVAVEFNEFASKAQYDNLLLSKRCNFSFSANINILPDIEVSARCCPNVKSDCVIEEEVLPNAK